jgi:predicted DNA-binding transcriptional regulator YafY
MLPALASGRISAAALGLRLGVSKTTAYEYLAAMREYGFAVRYQVGREPGIVPPS